MHLMGHDPLADWGTPPFHRDRNALLVAAEGGFGTVDLNAIDFETELAPQPEGTFYAAMTDSPATTLAWRRTMCEQALLYHGDRSAFERYAGEYILLQDGEVRWHSPEGTIRESRRALAGEHADHAHVVQVRGHGRERGRGRALRGLRARAGAPGGDGAVICHSLGRWTNGRYDDGRWPINRRIVVSFASIANHDDTSTELSICSKPPSPASRSAISRPPPAAFRT